MAGFKIEDHIDGKYQPADHKNYCISFFIKKNDRLDKCNLIKVLKPNQGSQQKKKIYSITYQWLNVEKNKCEDDDINEIDGKQACYSIEWKEWKYGAEGEYNGNIILGEKVVFKQKVWSKDCTDN